MATYKPKKKIDKNGTLEEVKIPIESVDGLDSKLNAKKGIEEVEYLDMYMGMVEPPQTDDGIYWSENAEFRDKHGTTLKTAETFHHIPISSGEGIKFEQDEEAAQVKISTDLPTVKAKLKPASEVGGGSVFDNLGNIDTWMDLPYDIEVAGIDGVSWNEAYVFQDKDGNIIASGDMAHRIPLQAGEGIEFVADNENNIVKINSTVETPTTTSQLENDSDFATNSSVDEKIEGLATVAISGSYNDLSNKPTIPTSTSQLTNNSDFATNLSVNTKIANLVNSAPEALNTLGELASALEDHEDAYDALLEVVGNKADKNEIKALVANTQEEFDALIIKENCGKTISYDGKLYLVKVEELESNPPQVGDTITELYFDVDAIVSEELLSVSTLMTGKYIDTPNKTYALLFCSSIGISCSNGSGTSQHIYSTAHNKWVISHVNYQKDATVSAVYRQELWGSFISKTPFMIVEAVEVGNALKATTQNEFDSLIDEENEDKIISYKGKLYIVSSKEQGESSINANDTVETLYFNTDIEPNFSDFVFEDGGAGLLVTDTNPTTDMISLLIVFEITEESFGGGTPNGYALAIQHDGQLKTLYATEDYDVGNIHASKGWNVDKFELGWSATIQTVLQQEKWGTFIGKTPFNKEIFAKEVGGADFEDVAHLDNHYTSVYVDENCIAFDGISELEDENGTAFSFSGSMKLPITAGEGIEFEPDHENNVVKINATGGSGGGISGAWTSGVGGTLTLPEAGIYQLKTDFSDGTVVGNTTFSQIVCWDGNLPTESATIMTLVESDLMCYRFSIGATGVINVKVTIYGQSPAEMDWANMNVEYRKIGEA